VSCLCCYDCLLKCIDSVSVTFACKCCATGCYNIIQGVTKIPLQLWKGIQICTEDIHCHNVAKHCQFYARSTVVPNTPNASDPAVEIKMATFTGIERTRCVFWFEETKFRSHYRKESPSRSTIYSWHKSFVEAGCFVRHAKVLGRPCVSHATVEQLRVSFVRNPRKPTRHASRKIGIPNGTVWRVLRKRLHLKAYLTDADKVVSKEFCMIRSIPPTAGSGAVKIHVSSRNMFVTVQRRTCIEPSAKKECTALSSSRRRPLPVSCIWISSSSSSPQLDEDDQEGRIHFQQDGAPRHLPNRSVPVSQPPFPWSLDWYSGADSMATSFSGS
jgi:hypothetical protein